MVFLQDGQKLVNVFHFKRAGGFADPTLLADLAADVITAWADHIQDLQVPQVTGLTVAAVDLTSASGSGIEIPNTLHGNGSNSPLPTNVTVSTKWITGFTGRSFRGRTYFIGLSGEQIAGNDLTLGAAGDIESSWNAFFDQLTAAGHTMVVVSYRAGGVPRTTAVATPIIGAVLADNHLDSQRRRLTGRGE
jgi:hypothetical protein